MKYWNPLAARYKRLFSPFRQKCCSCSCWIVERVEQIQFSYTTNWLALLSSVFKITFYWVLCSPWNLLDMVGDSRKCTEQYTVYGCVLLGYHVLSDLPIVELKPSSYSHRYNLILSNFAPGCLTVVIFLWIYPQSDCLSPESSSLIMFYLRLLTSTCRRCKSSLISISKCASFKFYDIALR